METFFFHTHNSVICVEISSDTAELCEVYYLGDNTNRVQKAILIDEHLENDQFVFVFGHSLYLDAATAIINHESAINWAGMPF